MVAVLKILRRLAFALLFTGFATLLAYVVLWTHYYDILPRSPQSATGRTYVMNMHGIGVYATQKERNRLDLLENVFIILLFAGIVGAVLTDPQYRQ